jgi:hypothetical protein
MLPDLPHCVDQPLLMAAFSNVASERLPVLHIRLNLPQN